MFDGVQQALDDDLPPLGDSRNGPELGFDAAHGIEVVYTKEIDSSHWFIARQSNSCFQAFENCWGPFATPSLQQPAKVVYLRDLDLPPRDGNRRLVWRDLEDPDLSHEQVLDDPNATQFGQWVRIDNEDLILTQYDLADGSRQIALYEVTPPWLGPALQIITSGAGRRQDPTLRLDPDTGRYTLVNIKSDQGLAGSDVVEVHQRICGTWTRLYEFNAAGGGEMDPNLSYVQSPELLAYQNHLYFAFITADTADFLTTTSGNIRISRVEGSGQPSYFRLLSDAGDPHRRIEPEMHFPTNDSPVVFCTQTALGDEVGCFNNDNMLFRARTLVTGG